MYFVTFLISVKKLKIGNLPYGKDLLFDRKPLKTTFIKSGFFNSFRPEFQNMLEDAHKQDSFLTQIHLHG